MGRLTVTHVALVLDKSGSMTSIREQTVNGYNEQIRTLKAAETPTNRVFLTRILFDHNIEVGEVETPISEAKELTHRNYRPDGMTAMYDAMGEAIKRLKEVHAGPDDAFLVMIVTDGEENSSKYFKGSQVSELVKGLQGTGVWTFSVIGANINLENLASHLHIPQANTFSYASTPSGTNSAWATINTSSMSYMGERERGVTTSSAFVTTDEEDNQEGDNKPR